MGTFARFNNTKLCEELLKNTIVQNESVADCHLTYFQDNKNSVDIKIATKKDEYGFVITFKSENGDGNFGRLILPQDDINLNIEDVRIRGYNRITPEEFGVLHLKCILKLLAFHHSNCISNGFREVTNLELSKDRYEDLLQFTENDKRIPKVPAFKKYIENLLNQSEDVIKADNFNIYVQSYIFENELLFFKNIDNENVDCKIVRTASKKYVPLVYDMLLSLYSFSTQKLRQHHFHELILYYYNELEENCNRNQADLSAILSTDEFYNKIKQLLPLVKLEMARYYCEKLDKSGENIYQDLILSAISELYECVLHPDLTREECYKILETKTVPHDTIILDWNLFSKDGSTKYFDLNICVKLFNSKETMSFFTILAPKKGLIKEAFFYSTFLNQINNLGLEQITDFCPKCYLARSSELLVLQDIASMRPLDIDGYLPYQHLRHVMKQLAKLHASSLLYEEIMTEKTGRRFRLDCQFEGYFPNPVASDDNIPEDKEVLPQVKADLEEEIHEETDFCVSYKNLSTYRNVICHGNLSKENLVFKESHKNVPSECYLVNFETVRYCPPTCDLLYLLCTNTNKELRSKCVADLIDEYYKELSAAFKMYGFDLNKIYTNKQIFECLTSTICQTLLTKKLFDVICDTNVIEAVEEIFDVCINECSSRYN